MGRVMAIIFCWYWMEFSQDKKPVRGIRPLPQGLFSRRGAGLRLTVHPGVVLASCDPVALDVQGVRLSPESLSSQPPDQRCLEPAAEKNCYETRIGNRE